MPEPQHKRGPLIRLFIVGFWAVMMTLLIQREFIVPHWGAGDVLAFNNRETDNWMGLYTPDDACMGVVNTQTRPQVRNGELGQQMRLWVHISIKLLSFPAELIITGEAWAVRGGGLRHFDLAVRSGDHKLRINAEQRDGRLKGEVHTAGEVIPLDVPVSDKLLFSGGMGTAAYNVPGLRAGDEVMVDTFDPMTMSVSQAKIRCTGEDTLVVGGKQVKAKIIETEVGGVATRAWISLEDEVLQAETPFGFTLKKLTRDEALDAMNTTGPSTSLITSMAVKPTGLTPKRGAMRVRIRIDGLPPGIQPPDDDTQRQEQPGLFTIQAPAEAVLKDGPSLSETDRTAALAGDAFVQTDHAKIVETATGILAGCEDDAWAKAQRLYGWVYENIEKVMVVSLPSALEVLKTRKGDCNEHTVLYAALARSAKIPTRIAVGLVWSDELKGFYYHAWPEVYMGRWTWIDPTLGQPVADATHIKLLTGGVENWSQLLPYIGQIRIEVLECQMPPAS